MRARALAVVLAALALAPASAGAHVLADQPDDQPGAPQVHLLYVTASDGPDRALDDKGTILNETQSWGRWLRGQTGGSNLRLDLRGGFLDVTFVRLAQTQAQLAGHGLFLRDAVQAELVQRGFALPNKVYLAYYDGAAYMRCGSAAGPDAAQGNLAIVTPMATPSDSAPCSTSAFASRTGPPQYLQFVAIHETLHVLGFAPKCSRHYAGIGHVGDDPRDVMYSGSAPWQPSILDVNHDDYFHAGIPGCLDVASDPYFAPASGTGATAPTPKSPTVVEAIGGRRVRAGRRLRLGLALSSSAGEPTGRCVLRRRVHGRYRTAARASVRGSRCVFRVRAPRRGVRTLRFVIAFAGTGPFLPASAQRAVTVTHRR